MMVDMGTGWILCTLCIVFLRCGRCEHAKFLSMDVYHTAHLDHDEEEEFFEKEHLKPGPEQMPVVQPWQGKSPGGERIVNGSLSHVYIDGIMKSLASILLQNGESGFRDLLDSLKLSFYSVSQMTRTCSRDNCKKITCEDQSLQLPPCGYICMSMEVPRVCQVKIKPYDGQFINVTLIKVSFPFCRFNQIKIDNSKPFCGEVGGIITKTGSPAITFELNHADHYNTEKEAYEYGVFEAVISYQAVPRKSPHLRTYDVRSMLLPNYPGIQFDDNIWGGVESIMHLKTRSHETGCIQFVCLQYRNRGSLTSTVTRGAPEFRYRQDAILDTITYECATLRANASKRVCVEAGEFTLSAYVSSKHTMQLSVLFVLIPIVCKSSNSWQCEQNTTESNNSTLLTFLSNDSPIAYIEHTYDASDFEGYIQVHIEEFDVEGLASPRHRECGAGGIYFLTEYPDWDIGILCGGYGSKTISFNRRHTAIQLSKRLRIVAKKYFAETKIRMLVTVEPSNCEGFVNLDFRHFPTKNPHEQQWIFIKPGWPC